MNSEVEICNAALSLIGQNVLVTLLNPATEQGKQCALWYPSIRDELLREHTWNFAEKRAILAELVDTPPFEFTKYFQLPADYIKSIRLYNNDSTFRIEGNRIATSATGCNLIYTAQVTDPTLFDEGFKKALYMTLAARLCKKVNGNNNLTIQRSEEAKEALFKAKQADSQEGTPIKIRTRNNVHRSRIGPFRRF